MEKYSYDNHMITQYLLGSLSDEETERLDELSFTDHEFMQRLQAVEDDLVDAYINGELSGEAMERFNAYYLVSQRRREKVKFAMALQLFTDPSAPEGVTKYEKEPAPLSPETDKPSSWWLSLPPFFGNLRPSFQWGLVAAAMLLLLISGWLMFNNLRLRSQKEQALAELAALRPREQEFAAQLEQQRSANSELEKDLESTRQKLVRLEQQQATGREGSKSQQSSLPKDLIIAHFDLAPQMRGIGQVPTISIPPGTDYVSLQLELEPGEHHLYRAELRSQSGNQIVWKSGKLVSRLRGRSRVTDVTIPASQLQSQWYILELAIFSGKTKGEVVSDYSFKVEKK